MIVVYNHGVLDQDVYSQREINGGQIRELFIRIFWCGDKEMSYYVHSRVGLKAGIREK